MCVCVCVCGGGGGNRARVVHAGGVLGACSRKKSENLRLRNAISCMKYSAKLNKFDHKKYWEKFVSCSL